MFFLIFSGVIFVDTCGFANDRFNYSVRFKTVRLSVPSSFLVQNIVLSIQFSSTHNMCSSVTVLS